MLRCGGGENRDRASVYFYCLSVHEAVKGKWWITSLWAAHDVSRLTSMFTPLTWCRGCLLSSLPFWFTPLLVSEFESDVLRDGNGSLNKSFSSQWFKNVLQLKPLSSPFKACFHLTIIFTRLSVPVERILNAFCRSVCHLYKGNKSITTGRVLVEFNTRKYYKKLLIYFGFV